MTAEQICTNCGNSFTRSFCNECGQKITHRISMAHFGHDIVHAFTHTDKGFFFMMLQLFRRPGVVAREYIIEGKRRKYFMPFQYILIIGAIATFVVANSQFIETTTQALGGGQYSARQAAFIQKLNYYQSKYYHIMLLAQLPFYALALKLVFRRQGLNFAEYLTLQTFITAQAALISMIIMLAVFLINKSGGRVLAFMANVTILYQVFAYVQFFRAFSFRGILKAALVNLVGILLFVLFVSVVVLAIGFSTKAFID